MTARTTTRAALTCLALLAWATATSAAPAPKEGKLKPEDVAKAEKAVKDYLEKIKGGYGTVTHVKDERLEKLFPRHAFFFVLYRQFPVGRIPPKGLKSANVLAVGTDAKVQVLEAGTKLLKFFDAHLKAAKTEAQMKDIARAYLRLAQDFRQDGFFSFELMDDATKVTTEKKDKVATATAVVMKGGSGTLTVKLTFDDEGLLKQASENSKLKRGPRPICQATKLLDPDPLIRRIVEQDLLIMGRAAKPYLDEQRAKASPELKRAIDRLWQRIRAEDR